MENRKLLIGFDIGGTKIALSLGDSAGKLLGETRIPNLNSSPDEVIPRMISEAKRLVAEAGLTMKEVSAFGISSPGSSDYKNGVMLHPTNNPKWVNVPILQLISDGLEIPGSFENDANCGMLAEWFFGAAKGARDAIYLTMSTGIGAGIIAAGHLVDGKSGQAGEVGHIVLVPDGRKCNCGLRGCYEAYCGGLAISQRMQEELADRPQSLISRLADGHPEKMDMIALEKAVRADDPYAVKLWAEVADLHARAIGGLINTLSPEKVVLGTFAWAIGDLFTKPILEKLPKYAWRDMLEVCDVVPSELGRGIGSYAGLAAALNGMYERGEFKPTSR